MGERFGFVTTFLHSKVSSAAPYLPEPVKCPRREFAIIESSACENEWLRLRQSWPLRGPLAVAVVVPSSGAPWLGGKGRAAAGALWGSKRGFTPVIGSASDWALDNCNFRFTPAVLHAIPWKKLLDNSKLKTHCVG